MATRRVNPGLVKMHRSYSTSELAICCKVHKNTVRLWQRQGLQPVDAARPLIFHGGAVRDFLAKRNTGRKCPCPPGTLYCFRCRMPRPPALGMVDFIACNATTGNVRAMCDACGTIMHRKARRSDLPMILPGLDVQMREASLRLKGSNPPSLNCDMERIAK